MEIFLLLLDEIDDLTHALRMLLPTLLGFLAALALFAMTVMSVMRWPWLFVIGGIAALLVMAVRGAIRAGLLARLKTDP